LTKLKEYRGPYTGSEIVFLFQTILRFQFSPCTTEATRTVLHLAYVTGMSANLYSA
jgi:hypothetical protein